MSFLGWQYELLCVTPYLVGRIKHWARWLCWERRTGSLLLVSLPHVIFSIADLNLYPFVVINLNNEYNCFAKFSEFFWWIIELEGSLGDSQAQSLLRVHSSPQVLLQTSYIHLLLDEVKHLSVSAAEFKLAYQPCWLFWHSSILRSVKCPYFSLLFPTRITILYNSCGYWWAVLTFTYFEIHGYFDYLLLRK